MQGTIVMESCSFIPVLAALVTGADIASVEQVPSNSKYQGTDGKKQSMGNTMTLSPHPGRIGHYCHGEVRLERTFRGHLVQAPA